MKVQCDCRKFIMKQECEAEPECIFHGLCTCNHIQKSHHGGDGQCLELIENDEE